MKNPLKTNKQFIMKNINIYIIIAFLFANLIVEAQKASEMPIGKSFIIQSAISFGRNESGCWDLAGSYGSESQFIKGKNIQVWQLDNSPDRVFTIAESSVSGYYELMVGRHSIARVDISGGKQVNHANIRLWDDNNSTAQRFLFKHLGNGRFKIYTTNGKIINLKNNSNNNGTNIQLWDDNNGINSEWYFIDPNTRKAYIPKRSVEIKLVGDEIPQGKYYIQSAISYGRNNMGFWDIPGRGNSALKNKANLQIWENDYLVDRKFAIYKNHSHQYYNLVVGSYSVDLFGGKTANGSNVGIFKTNFSNINQSFYFEHLGNGRFKIHHSNGKILAITEASNSNNKNIHLWQNHNSIQAEWYLISVKTGKAYIPASNNSNNSNNGNGWDGENNEGGSSGNESGGW